MIKRISNNCVNRRAYPAKGSLCLRFVINLKTINTQSNQRKIIKTSASQGIRQCLISHLEIQITFPGKKIQDKAN